MMKIRFVLVLFVSLLLLMSCDKRNTTENQELSDLTVIVNLQPVLHHYLPVTRVTVQAVVPDSKEVYELIVDSTFATGVIPNLEAGSYYVVVNIYSDSVQVALGSNTSVITEGEDATVLIEPEMSAQIYNKVLFVGNSHTYYNQGVDYHLLQLISGCFGPIVSSFTEGGYTLQNHFNDPGTIITIQQGDWDLVILQEASSTPVNDPDLFYEYATKLDTVVRGSGARTGFYMTWAWKNNPEMYEPVTIAYNTIGAELQALVAPCGIAFHNALQADSTLSLYASDNYHPSLLGTFLASCVFYASIWNYNPSQTAYVPAGMDTLTATALKQIAWNTVQEYQASKEQRNLDRLIGGLPKLMAIKEQEHLLKAE